MRMTGGDSKSETFDEFLTLIGLRIKHHAVALTQRPGQSHATDCMPIAALGPGVDDETNIVFVS